MTKEEILQDITTHQKYKVLRCKQESLREDGSKIMQFTKGREYVFSESQCEEDVWVVLDDNYNLESFFNLDIMFEEL